MAWLFLLLSLGSAGLTYNTFRPLPHGQRRMALSFFASWFWGELALHAIALQVVAVFIFTLTGALQSWVGVLALAITIGSCAALAVAYRNGLLADPVVERALRESFGRGYEESVLPELSSRFERGIRWRPILRPFPITHPDVERISGIPFARDRGVTLKLDVYRHRSMPDGCPTLLQIHGGAWVIGDKREQALPLMNQLASRGWVCISANYRLSPHATFPDHLIDVKQALRWIREHGHRYGANPDFVIITGGSAGGHLASLAALTAGRPEYQPGFEDVDTSVKGCVPIYAVFDFTDRHGLRITDAQEKLLAQQVMKGTKEEMPDAYRDASPMDQVGSDVPPFMIVHGDRDTLVPVEEARRFTALLREKAAARPVYVEIPGAQHAFELFPSLRTQAVVDGIERFASYIYSDHLRRAASRPVTKPADAPAAPVATSEESRKAARSAAAKKAAATRRANKAGASAGSGAAKKVAKSSRKPAASGGGAAAKSTTTRSTATKPASKKAGPARSAAKGAAKKASTKKGAGAARGAGKSAPKKTAAKKTGAKKESDR